MQIRTGKYLIHNKEQWDLDCTPIVCIHMYRDGNNICKRILCIYRRNKKLSIRVERFAERLRLKAA